MQYLDGDTFYPEANWMVLLWNGDGTYRMGTLFENKSEAQEWIVTNRYDPKLLHVFNMKQCSVKVEAVIE